MVHVSYEEIVCAVRKIYAWAKKRHFDCVYGIPRGGLVPAVMLSHLLHIPLTLGIDPSTYTLVVDEIVDSGYTYNRFREDYSTYKLEYACIYKRHSAECNVDFCAITIEHDDWIVFPWELTSED